MRIAASTVSLSSTHAFSRAETEVTRLRVSAGAPVGPAARAAPSVPGRERGSIQGAGPGTPAGSRNLPGTETTVTDAAGLEDDDPAWADAGLRVLIAIVERLTGRRVRIARPEEVNGAGRAVPSPPATIATGSGAGLGGLRIAFEHYHRVEEAEQTMVRAAATVTMEDGSTRSVQLELAMSRRFVQEHLTRANVVLGEQPVDPLVITLAPQGARFGPGVLHFDLDLDGTEDAVRMTAGVSAYLVDDRDGNGAITDGSELFGPRTGDGFAELAAHDEDGNGWIDPGDTAYHRLRLALDTGSGEVTLRGLAESGVTAIGVDRITSPFRVTYGDESVGQVRSTGLVLLGSGGVGTVQHVDLFL